MSASESIFEPMFGPAATWGPSILATKPGLLATNAIPEPDVLWASAFLSGAEQDTLFVWCRDEIVWKYVELYTGGKSVLVPRGLAWFGDVPYSYSGLTHKANPMPTVLRQLADRIEDALARHGTPAKFNSVLMNFYRDGDDSIGMHSDDESQLDPEPTIASVSLGSVREFRFQHKLTRTRHQSPLPGGSLLIMKGATQTDWRHGVPKQSGASARVNLTFRLTHRAPLLR